MINCKLVCWIYTVRVLICCVNDSGVLRTWLLERGFGVLGWLMIVICFHLGCFDELFEFCFGFGCVTCWGAFVYVYLLGDGSCVVGSDLLCFNCLW